MKITISGIYGIREIICFRVFKNEFFPKIFSFSIQFLLKNSSTVFLKILLHFIFTLAKFTVKMNKENKVLIKSKNISLRRNTLELNPHIITMDCVYISFNLL